jgi:RsiW-degrading membrane proteinase PrsW (M82 family)
VAMYLMSLMILDSYKLVKLRAVILAVVVGWVALLICNYLNGFLMNLTGVDSVTFSKYLAPVTEETTKAAYLVFLIRSKRVGFLVDAVILGFAVGAGFGILENIFYLSLIPDTHTYSWLLRGCGTALMHGSTTAIFCVLAQREFERANSGSLIKMVPPLVVAIIMHSFYNHFFLSPAYMALVLTLGVPLTTTLIYRDSERSLEKWLGAGFDTDAETLEIINMGKVSESRLGTYITSLGAHFPPLVMVDIMCLLKIRTELAMAAKGILILRREGIEIEASADLLEKFEELNFLEKSIGPTGLLAIKPLRRSSGRDDWEKHLLRQ